jgi:hypothetical protein
MSVVLSHSRKTGYVAIGRTPHNGIFVIPGLTRNPVLFQSIASLDAGSVIPDLIRDRHDGQNLNSFLNYDTVWKAGIP